MTTISTGFVSPTRSTTEHKASAMFTRFFTLFAAAGRAVPFHRESGWGRIGSTGITDRDQARAALELSAIASMREHG
ncbi:hypothetical protein OHB26_38405 [Nocardia sp. NBC_01503]|uniref:hypothetical protein n=1 Tax=Nocardia sp. NBC_01503 TaxID=2975997 RepID=UPI002E7C4A68|nr:hypothetical protein [Nocardia sp. NBC_01503]WTL32652.1 hypothetical protein OHB26_38405 [Nocardia sp. NBC_01503]